MIVQSLYLKTQLLRDTVDPLSGKYLINTRELIFQHVCLITFNYTTFFFLLSATLSYISYNNNNRIVYRKLRLTRIE